MCASMVAGCASPLDSYQDEPQYRSLQSKYVEHDRQVAESSHDLPVVMVNALKDLDQLSVDDAIRIAIEHNPQLRATGYLVDAATGRVMQSGLYPNPTVSLAGESIGADQGGGGESTVHIEQEILLGGRLKHAKSIAISDRDAAREEYIANEFAIAAQTSNAYFQAVSAQERLGMHQELVELSTQLLDGIKARVEAGSASEIDLLRGEVAFEQSRLGLDAAQFQAQASHEYFISMLGLDEPIDIPMSTSIDELPDLPLYEDILSSTLSANSRVSLARVAIERARNEHQLAKANSRPDLFVSVGPRYSDIDNETTIDVGLSLEVPLFDRNQGAIDAALSERLSASAQLQSIQIELASEVSAAWSVYQSAFSATNRYQNRVIPKAEQTLDLTRQAYQGGKADYLRLLDAQQIVIESRLAYLTTLEQLHSAAALLNQLSQSNASWRIARNDKHENAEDNQ